MAEDRSVKSACCLFPKVRSFFPGFGPLAAVCLLAVLFFCPAEALAEGAVSPGGNSAAATPIADPQELLDAQRAKNAVLAAEANRLRAGLGDDPCNAHKYLTPPLASAVPPGQSGPDSRTLGEIMEQATVMVFVLLEGGMGFGTGFFIGPDLIMTNRHVVDHPKAECFVTNKALGHLTEVNVVAVGQGEGRDYALLRLTGAERVNYALSFATDVKRTDKVGAWGFPGSVTGYDPQLWGLLEKGDLSSVPEVIYSEGVVSVILDHDPPSIVHTAMISQGNSGGPLVNERGEVVGINTMISLDKKSYRQMGISLASGDIIQFLQANGVSPLMGSGQGR